MSAPLSTLLFIDEAKADKIKAALLAKYPNDLDAVNKVLAANMLGPATWFPVMELSGSGVCVGT